LTESALSQIKKSVTFIYLKDSDRTYLPLGTGFFVGIRAKLRKRMYHQYLVTCKHVLQDVDGNFFPIVSIRLNTKDGSSKFIEIPTKEIPMLTHKDDSVDIAVLPFSVDEKALDYLMIPDDLITTKETMQKLKIDECDDVLFAGLFESHMGQKRNQPIIRHGKVALISDEKVEFEEVYAEKPSKSVDAYLLECTAFGGNSGSPVFFEFHKDRKPKPKKKFYLAGVMTAFFSYSSDIPNLKRESELYSVQNVGISAVTPSHQLYDILFSKEAKKLREAEIV